MSLHVMPRNDIKNHTQESTCSCQPTLKQHSGEMVFVHNSFDCREALEKALDTADSDVSMEWYLLYIEELYYMEKFGRVNKDWVKDKVKYASIRMYEHWRKLDIQIVWEENKNEQS